MIISNNAINMLKSGQINFRYALWLNSKNRITGDIETLGLYSGLDDLTIAVDGQTRTYTGAGQLLSIPNLKYRSGFDIQAQTLSLAITSPEMIEIIKLHNPQYQPADLHVILLENGSDRVVEVIKSFDGQIDGCEIVENIDSISCEITLVSSLRAGTKPLYTKQSNEDQLMRSATDYFRQYQSTSGKGNRFWGMESEKTHHFNKGGNIMAGAFGSFVGRKK